MSGTFKPNVQLADLSSELLRSAWQFWDEARKGAELPPVSAINATRLPKPLMPFIVVIAVEENPQRFLLRLIGNAGIVAAGRNQTGLYTDQMPDSAAVTQRLGQCVSSRRPYYYEGKMGYAAKVFRSYQTLGLPFADQDGKITRLLNATEFLDA